jgi:PAS domain S-box-containing protein
MSNTNPVDDRPAAVPWDAEADFRLLADALPQIVWTTDPDGRAGFFNQRWSAYTGLPSGESIPSELAVSFIHPEDVPATTSAWAEASREARSFQVEHRLRSASGEYRWFLLRGEPRRDPDTGAVVRWFGTSTDVHARKLAELRLAESEARCRTLEEERERTAGALRRSELRVLGQRSALDMVLSGAPFEGILNRVVLAARDVAGQGAHTALFLVDESGTRLRFGASSGLEESFMRAADALEISPESPSCGVAALAGDPVVVRDVLEDPGWVPYLALAREHGIRSCWSFPIRTSDSVVGTLAVYHDAPREADPDRLEAIDLVARTAALIIERWQDGEKRRAAEEAVRESESKYRTLFDRIDEGFCILQVIFDGAERPTDYRYLEVNPAFERQTGMTDAVGRTIRELVPDIEPFWFDIYGDVALTGQPTRFVDHAESMGRWFDVYAFRVGAPRERRVAVLFQDITERQRAQEDRERLLEELRLERARLEYVFERAPAVLAVMRGPDHVFELVNDRYRSLVGNRELLGRRVAEALPEVVGQGFIELLDSVLRSGEPFVGGEVPLRLARTPGAPPEERFVDFAYIPLLEADGTRSGVVAHGNDVTDHVLARREIERLLRESEAARADAEAARTEAESANRAKADFLASMSHELRTPLNAIGGYVDLLDLGIQGPLAEAQREALARVTANQRHLLTLINDVLAFARLEAGQIEMELRPLPACAVQAAVEPLVAPLAEAKEITLTLRECDRTLRVLGDEERIRQILLNLVGNAVKFTSAGGRVSRSCEADGEWVYMRVQDDGPGIPLEEQARIFDPFQQVGRRLNQPGEGVGLGLAISRDLARAMGGDLTVESAPGRGSSFTLRLPRAPAAD